jgi:hypothetical protein
MAVSSFPIGFWNYISIKDVDETVLKDWEESGISMLMSPSYTADEKDRVKMHEILQWCYERSIRVMLQDPRISLSGYLKDQKPANSKYILPAHYEQEAKAAVDEFGSHPSVFSFFIIDEPAWNVLDATIEAVNIVKKLSGKLPFVNFLPYYPNIWERIHFKDYGKYIQNYIEKTGVDLICYDFYAQLTERQYEDPIYYTNLKYFRDNSLRLGINFWNTILSTPHFRYRKPTYDDIRWQVNTSLAYGAKGILYFTFNTPDNVHNNETNYRQGPINWWGERTDTFYHLRDVNREVHKRWGDRFMDLELVRTDHYPQAPVDTLESFKGDGMVKDMKVASGMDPHVIVSEFKSKTNSDRYIFVVNANPRDSIYISLGMPDISELQRFTMFGRQYPVNNEITTMDYFETRLWLAPGQGELLLVK